MAIPQVTPFKVTADDLEGLDTKTRNGLEPLLDALNTSFNQVVAATAAAPAEQLIPVTLITQTTVADSFPLTFKTTVVKPSFVSMCCTPKDPGHTLTDPFVMQGFSVTDAGLLSIPKITNLLANNTYNLVFFVR